MKPVPDKTIYIKNSSGRPNTIGIKLKAEMKKNGLSAAELARRSGVLTSFIYDIISGKSSNPSIIKLAKVADALGIDLPYLVNSDLKHGSIAGITEEKYVLIPQIKLNISKNTTKNIISFKETGEPYLFRSQWLNEHFNAGPNSLRMFAINCDSMEPSICYNDIVMIDTSQKSPSQSGIFILFDGQRIIAKRLEYVFSKDSQRIRIISDNTRYSTYEHHASEVVVVGKVVWLSREI